MKNINKKNIKLEPVTDPTDLPDLSDVSDLSKSLNSDKPNHEDIFESDTGPFTSLLSDISKEGDDLDILKMKDNLSHKNIFKADDVYKIFPPLGIARIGNGPANQQDALFISEVPWQNLYETENNYLTADDKVKKVDQRFRLLSDNGTKPSDASKFFMKWTV